MNHPGLVSCMSDVVFAAALAHGAIHPSHDASSLRLPLTADADGLAAECACLAAQPQRYVDRLAVVLAASDGFALPGPCAAAA